LFSSETFGNIGSLLLKLCHFARLAILRLGLLAPEVAPTAENGSEPINSNFSGIFLPGHDHGWAIN
jgi:hypothetical protein